VVSHGIDGVPRLKTRRLDQSRVTEFSSTDGVSVPFFSPDRPGTVPPDELLRNLFDLFPGRQWIAYGSGAYGSWVVYVRPSPVSAAAAVHVSRGGGRIPRWLPNGRELVYRTDDQRLMVMPYTVKDRSFVAGDPREWTPRQFGDIGVLSNFDIDRTGNRVLAPAPRTSRGSTESCNWRAQLLGRALRQLVARHGK